MMWATSLQLLTLLLILLVKDASGRTDFIETPTSINVFLNSTAQFLCSANEFALFFHLIDFIETPTSMNVFLNSTAQFLCSANEFALFWLVDGEGEATDSIQNRGVTSVVTSRPGGGAIATLCIEASARNNNSVIQCGVFVNGIELLSEPVELHIQGLLDAPENLTVVSILNNTTILLTWIPPYTLNVTEVDPDISAYAVSIFNHNTGKTRIVIADESQYRYVRETEDCHLLEFSVSAINQVGQGRSSSSVTAAISGVPTAISKEEVDITMRFLVHSWEITIMIPFHSGNGFDFSVKIMGVHPNELQQTLNGSDTMSLYSDNTTVAINVSTMLPSNQLYQATVLLQAGGCSYYTEALTLSTFDVVDVIVVTYGAEDATAVATCSFAEGSPATGCLLIFVSLDQSHTSYWAAFRQNLEPTISIMITDLRQTNYSVLAFDIESNGLPSTHAAASTEFTAMNEMADTNLFAGTSDVEITLNGTVFCAVCYFNASDDIGCVVIVQTIGRPTEIAVHFLRREPLEAYVNICIETPTTNYSIAIFYQKVDGKIGERPKYFADDINEESMTTGTSSPAVTVAPKKLSTSGLKIGIISGSAAIVVSIILMITVVICVVGSKVCLKKGDDNQVESIEMKNNQAYEAHLLARKPKTAPNPAYNVVSLSAN